MALQLGFVPSGFTGQYTGQRAKRRWTRCSSFDHTRDFMRFFKGFSVSFRSRNPLARMKYSAAGATSGRATS